MGNKEDIVYKRSGKSGNITEYTDLTYLAGQQVSLSLHLSSDGSYNGDGWDISGLSIFTSLSNGLVAEKAALKSAKIAPLSLGGSSIADIQITDVNADNFPEAVFVNFTAKDANGNFIQGLDINDLSIWEEGTTGYGCLKLLEDKTLGGGKPIDVVFLVDNSGSMSPYQNNIRNNINSLLQVLATNYDVQAGLVRFGHSAQRTLCPAYGQRALNGSQFFTVLNNSVSVSSFMSNVWRSE